MVRKTFITLALFLAVAAVTITWTANAHTVLFHAAYWWLVGAVIAGTAAGIIKAVIQRKANKENAPRHTVGSFLQHWGTGVGIIILIVSGVLLASGRRLWIISIPEVARSRIMALNLHWLGAFYALLFGCFFLADFLAAGGYKALVPNVTDIRDGTIKHYLLRKPWEDKDKYLVSQKWAFVAFTVLGGIVLVTGLIKTAYFIWPFSQVTASNIHDIAAELFFILLVVHVLIVLAMPAHWRLLLSWFTGKREQRIGNSEEGRGVD